MKRKFWALILALSMILALSGCSRVEQIADSVMDAAMQELKNQVKQVLEENKRQRHIRGGLATRKKYRG